MTAGTDAVATDRNSIFRRPWRDSRSAPKGPGKLIEQPQWIGAGLVALAVLLSVGVAAASTVTVAGTEALPAVTQGDSVVAMRSGEAAPELGAIAEFRDSSGKSWPATVVEVTTTQVRAHLTGPSALTVGELVVPAGQDRLIDILVPGLG